MQNIHFINKIRLGFVYHYKHALQLSGIFLRCDIFCQYKHKGERTKNDSYTFPFNLHVDLKEDMFVWPCFTARIF